MIHTQATELAHISSYLDTEALETPTEASRTDDSGEGTLSKGETKPPSRTQSKEVTTVQRKSSAAPDATRPSDEGELSLLTATATWVPEEGWAKWEEKWSAVGRKRRRTENPQDDEKAKDDAEETVCAGPTHHNVKTK